MKKGMSEIVLIIDRSGSMASLVDDAIGGLNTFIDEQKKVPGEAKITVVMFNHEYDIHDSIDLWEMKPFDRTTYVPNGYTALLDAVARTIDSVGERLASTPELDRPEHVIVGILTDGLENASKEYTHAQVLQKINHQRASFKWEFIYLGANQDSFAEGAKLGIAAKDIVNFAATPDGVRAAYKGMSRNVMSYRIGK